LPSKAVATLISECKGKTLSSTEEVKLPEIISEYAENIKDWNKRTIKNTLELFDGKNGNEGLKPSFCKMPLDVFWTALLRGGIQGILYVATKYAGERNE
jgi:hypothetical protein